MMECDLQDLESAKQTPWYLPPAAFKQYGYKRRHYMPGENSLYQTVVNKITTTIPNYQPHKISVISQFSCFGYCFNPITIYCAYNHDQTKIVAVVLEVTNTPWHEKKVYVLSPHEKPPFYHARFDKQMHVSPFMDMRYVYDLTLFHADHSIYLKLENHRDNECCFRACLNLKKIPVTKTRLLWHKIKYPLMTQRITWQIYKQAFNLWRKGVSFVPHPNKNREPT